MTFAEHVADYARAGWPCIIPVPAETKFPPPAGFTGAEGRDTDPMQLVAWAGSHAGHSIALRMPDGVIGIDVDQYLKGEVQKNGAETVAHCEAGWGPLPPTWTSTARGPDQPSRIHFFRVPPGRYATKLGPDVEVIQRHHRYAVVAPSPHPGAGAPYAWYDPAGVFSELPPKPDELPFLPAAWVAGLAEGATTAGAGSASYGEGEALLAQLEGDWRPECAELTSARLALEVLGRADEGNRHDTATERAHHIVQTAAAGHAGSAYAVAELREAWARVTAGEDRGEELERMLLTSARKAVTATGPVQVPSDPCLLAGAFPTPAPSPEGALEDESEPIAPPRWVSTREYIGAHAFDPNADLDQSLAERVLERTYPALRYAWDAKTWLKRTPECWEAGSDLAEWAVAQVAPLMPLGDPTAEKGSDAHARAKRRARLMTQGGAAAIAKKSKALVAGGSHPVSLALADLDRNPDLLWAGGQPWSLRDSLAGPVLARIDPATPHLRAAAVAPVVGPTPLWDAFTAAVWPDPGVRAWSLRVLGIALTGHADRALPILLGETGRGKTQVIALLMSVLGSYAHAANPKLLSANSNEHDTIVYALKGRRLSFIDEAPSEAKVGQERLKQLTGGGELTARQMNQDPVTFRPTHTLVLTSNDEPTLTDPAIRARARLIPCDGDPEAVRLARAAIGHVSGPAWRAEAPGVLAAMMREAAAWLAEPATGATAAAPEHIRYLAERVGAEQDPVAVWVTEETEPHEAGTPSRELYQAFTASCLRNNLRRDAIPSETKWGRGLGRLGYPPVRTNRSNHRQLRIRPQTGFPVVGPIGGGLGAESGGFVEGSNPNPPPVFPQVTPSESVASGGCGGLDTPLAHTGAPTRTRTRGDLEVGVNPPPSDGDTGVDQGEHPEPTLHANPPPPPAAKKPTEATLRAAEKRAQARVKAIAAAAGPRVALPAVVTRDGSVRACTLEQADQLLATITAGTDPVPRALTVDVETTGYPVGHRDYALRTVQLGNEHLALVLDPGWPACDTGQADVVRRHLAAAEILHAHSATADLVPLADAGLVEPERAWSRMLDTVVLAKLADPTLTGSDPGLKQLSRTMLGDAGLSKPADEARAALFKAGKWLTETKVTTPPAKSGWAQVDSSSTTMVRYAAADVLDDAAIAVRLLAADQRAPADLLDRERATQRMTARVARVGLRIDGEHTERLLSEHTELRAAAAQSVAELTAHLGDAAIANPGSGPQVAAALTALGVPLPRTATGRASVAEAVLTPLAREQGPGADLATTVLGYRKHDTAIGTFLEPYRQLVLHGDGRARPTVYTLAADTGRMSCVRPNLQQVPREGGFRGCITADPGHLLVSADFASVELRVAAALSGDQNMQAILADPERDVHWETARLAFGPQATKADRYSVKRGVFGRIYGGGVGAIARGVGVTEPVAQTIIDALDAMFPQLSEWSRMVRRSVESGHTKFPTYAGRVVHLAKGEPHKAPNYCIQGTARELLIDALLRWAETPWGECVLLPVHDELVVHVPQDQAADAQAALVECMTAELLGVPIKAEANAPAFAWQDSA